MPFKPEDREYRAVVIPLQINPQEKRIDSEYYVEGFATTFDKPYLLYEYDGIKYYETIDRKALEQADLSDVIMQYNHAGNVLARISNDTLGIEAAERGLFVYADLSKSQPARTLYEEIESGLVTKMSWGFRVLADGYDKTTRTRTITKIGKVYDVSAVSLPANGDTEISARSFIQGRLEAEAQERRREELRKRKLKLLTEVLS